MRAADRDRLNEPRNYPDGQTAERDLEVQLNVSVPSVWALGNELLSDLDAVKYGIGWWQPHPDDKRRILIADHLIQSIQSISVNLMEAALHSLEYLDSAEGIGRKMARTITGNGQVRYPPPLSAADLLPDRLSTLHICGFFRSLASALDCLAAAAVGVLAIPQPILKADFASLGAWLSGTSHPRQVRLPIHRTFATHLRDADRRSGPAGWTEWIVGYRNMLVHRGRRTELNMLRAESHVVDAQGKPILLAVPVLLLAKDPHLSDVQAQLIDPINVVREDATALVPALLESTRHMVQEVTEFLVDCWKDRRAGTIKAPQPREQWPRLVGRAVPFDGYESRKLDVTMSVMMTAPSGLARRNAACLDSQKRKLWDVGLTGT